MLLLFSMILLMVSNLICSYNNVIFILNFICLLFIFIFLLFVFNLINMTLFILLIYATLINLLFLVNGLLLISSYSYIYYSLSSYLVINNLKLDVSLSLSFHDIINTSYLAWMNDYFITYHTIESIRTNIGINHYHNTIIYLSTFTIYNLCYLSSNSTLLNLGLNRLANVIFDNSLFCLLWWIFFINLTNLNIIFIHY